MREAPCPPRSPHLPSMSSLQTHWAGNPLPFLLTSSNEETHGHRARKPYPPLNL